MIRYDFTACIGADIVETGPLVKCHDTGITLAVHLVRCRKTSPWRMEKTPYIIPEGSKALFRVKKPDKTAVNTDVGVSIEGKSTVICEGIVQAFTAAGICNAEIVLYDPEGKRLTTATFTYVVTQECVCGTDTPSADYFDILSADIKAVGDAAKTAKEAADTAAGLCANPPKLSESLTWLVWDADAGRYVDTGISGIGAEGPQGPPGADGYTPIRGTDYWTDADKKEIQVYIDEQMGDISTALDSIIEMQKAICGLIAFTIDGVTYYAVKPEGSSADWPAWLTSSYNTLGVYRGESDSKLYTPDGGKIYNSAGEHQTAWANIEDEGVYTIRYEEDAE